jgi:tetratricopeptide (TPR) repeat protein
MRLALVQLYRGKALYALGDWDGSEAALTEALRLDPLVPEAGWGLLNQYYQEWRAREAQALALRLHAIEPDPRDRVQYLLELVRQDAQPPDPASVAEVLGPIVAARPDQDRPTLTLGTALVLASRIDDGLALLQQYVEAHPDSAEGWDALLNGLDRASKPELFLRAIEQVPPEMLAGPRFARHRAFAAQERGDWPAAAAAYAEAVEHDPLVPDLLYRLGLALRNAGRAEEAEAVLARHAAYKAGMAEVRALYDEANGRAGLGYTADAGLYRRLADLRERMSRPAEARAWYALALEADPADAEARAALARLPAAAGPPPTR